MAFRDMGLALSALRPRPMRNDVRMRCAALALEGRRRAGRRPGCCHTSGVVRAWRIQPLLISPSVVDRSTTAASGWMTRVDGDSIWNGTGRLSRIVHRTQGLKPAAWRSLPALGQFTPRRTARKKETRRSHASIGLNAHRPASAPG